MINFNRCFSDIVFFFFFWYCIVPNIFSKQWFLVKKVITLFSGLDKCISFSICVELLFSNKAMGKLNFYSERILIFEKVSGI